MARTGRLLWAALTLAVLLLLLWPAVRVAQRELTLEPIAAWVGIERGNTGRAEVGAFELAVDEAFTLHAILEARRGERRLFFTEAKTVVLEGEELTGETVRPWDGNLEPLILWFTVEPRAPIVRAEEDPVSLHYQSNFRADWPRAWRASGRLDPYRRRLTAGDATLAGRFGTQRYQVRIELFGADSAIRPRHRVTSHGPERLVVAPVDFPTAVVALPGKLGPSSRVFGLPQVVGELDEEAASVVARWHREGLAFRLPHLLRELSQISGQDWERLSWRTVDLAEGPPWGEAGVAAGDLLRVGNRVVVVYRDDGTSGRLDGGDLCFDYLEGPTVERLENVFSVGGLVEWGSWAEGGGR